MFVCRKKYSDEVKADTMLRDVMQGMSVPPTANLLLTRSTSFPPTVPRPPVRLYIAKIYAPSFALLIVDGRSDCLLKPDVALCPAYLWLRD